MRIAVLTVLLALQDDAVEKVWQLDLKSPSYGSGAVGDIDGDGRPEIVFGTYFNDECLYAVNAENGSILWKHKSEGGPFDASVAIADLDGDKKPEILSADSSTGTLFCLDGNGKPVWTVKLPSGTDSPPAVADLDGDGTMEIVVGTMWRARGMGGVTVISARDRKTLWQAEVPGCVQSEPCLVDLDGDKVLDVIVTSWQGDGCVRAFSGKDGGNLWVFKTDEADAKDKSPGSMYHGVSAAELRTGEGLSIVFATCGGTAYALDSKGTLRWKTRFPNEYLFAPTSIADLDGDGAREIVAAGRNLYVLDATGKERWCWKGSADSIDRGAALADIDGDGDEDVIFGVKCALVALDGPTGKEIWKCELRAGGHPYESIGSAPLIADFDNDGQLDVFVVTGKGTSDNTRGGNYGRAYVLRAGKGKGPGWETFRGNLRRTGTR